jgi:DNA-binding SARP family transcriptional activator
MNADTTLVLLDVPHLRRGTQRLDLPNNLPGHLIAYLALAGDWVTREALAAVFWPDRVQADAQHNLRVNLHRTKKQLDEWQLGASLHVEQRRVRLALDTDVARLRQAAGAGDFAAALNLCRRPFMSGMSLAGFPVLQEWLDQERAAVQTLLERCSAAPPAPGAATPSAGRWPRRLAAPPLVGRAPEQAALARSSAALLLVEGAPGIGKTRLLAEGLAHAAWLTCSDDRSRPPLDPLLVYLEDAQDALQGRPGWADLAPLVAAGTRQVVQPSRLLAAATALLASLARPVVVDDLQWADASLLELLRRLLAAGVPVRASLRERECPPALAEWLALRAEDSTVERLPLAPLPAAATAELLGRLAGAPAPRFADWLHARAGGHPLLTLELLRALFTNGRLRETGLGWASDLDAVSDDYAELAVPAQVWALVERRLAALPPAVFEVLAAAAVAGDARRPALLAAVVGQTPLAAGQALAAAQAQWLLDGARFAHPLMREAVLRRLPPPVLAGLHAAWLQHGAGELPPHALAAHAWAAGDEAAAVPQELAAAALDRRRGLHAAASASLRSALDRCTSPARRAALHAGLARTALEAGDFEAAAGAAQAALASLPEPAVRQQVLMLQADLALQHGQLDAAGTLAREAAAVDPGDRALRLFLARLAFERGAFGDAIAGLQPLLSELRREPPGEDLVQVLTELGTAHDALGQGAAGLPFHQEALVVARALGARRAEVDATVNLLWTLPDLGRRDEAIALGEQALALGEYDGTPALMNNLAYLYWDAGRLDDAERLYEQLSRAKDPTVRCFAWAKRIALAARRDDTAGRDAAIDAALATLDETQAYRAHAIVIIAVLTHGAAAQRAQARRWWRPDQALDPALQAQLDAALAHPQDKG